jgi:hypothetical protein
MPYHKDLAGADLHEPKTHATSHVDGTDDIQSATGSQKGLMTADYAAKLEDIEADADVTDADNVAAAGAVMYDSAGTGDIETSGVIQGGKCGVFGYLSAPAVTTITTVSTWYPILGTFVNSPLENFEAATVYPPGIKYVGSETLTFCIQGQTSFKTDSNTVVVSVAAKKNNVIIPGSEMPVYAKVSEEPVFLAESCVVELAQNDEIQLVMTADASAEDITVDKFTVTISRFFV